MSECYYMVVVNDDEVSNFITEKIFKKVVEEFNYPFKVDIATFCSTDDSINFIKSNAASIFCTIQDSNRIESKTIKQWKSFNKKSLTNYALFNAISEFSLFVADAFIPEAGQMLGGSSSTPEEMTFISNWAKLDSRILHYCLPVSKDKMRNALDFQLKRWLIGKQKVGVSVEGQLIHGVSEELSILCSSRPDYLYELSPRQLEKVLRSIFKNNGFEVHLTKQTKDHGYDILVVSNSKSPSETLIVEVKHFAPNRPVGVGIVRALYGVKSLNSFNKGILATSSYVTDYAKREFSRVIPWELEFVERKQLLEWCTIYVKDVVINAV